jgi:hypothetical protein
MPLKDAKKRREKQREYSAKHYAKNKASVIARTRLDKQAKHAKWRAFKAEFACTKCGFSHPAAIDFHHTDPSTKKDCVFNLIDDGRYASAYKEVEKCVALCANCHRIHHHDERALSKKPRKKKKKGAKAP